MFSSFCLFFVLQYVIVIGLTGFYSMFTDGDAKKFFKRIFLIVISIVFLLWVSYIIFRTDIENFMIWIASNDNAQYFIGGFLYYLIFWYLVLLLHKIATVILKKAKNKLYKNNKANDKNSQEKKKSGDIDNLS